MGYYRDAWAGGLFLLHVLIIFIMAVGLGASASEPSNGKGSNDDLGAINASMVGGVTLLLALSAVLATAWQQFLMHYGSAVVSEYGDVEHRRRLHPSTPSAATATAPPPLTLTTCTAPPRPRYRACFGRRCSCRASCASSTSLRARG